MLPSGYDEPCRQKRPSRRLSACFLTEEGWTDLAAALEPYALTGTVGKFFIAAQCSPMAGISS